ncbi:hypothetical protein DFP72DRAFT_861389 [Ephemerocybe angulata]|uniref:Uncharacterized protein n=1 Tax=Ephemerocybe angulata TaxID=980116 RepID=A0A8H6H9U9_9AGAR|nr:hypothetical protein DFP72DRAFT_861389 [Tulosesus angulatus]
MYLLLRGPQLNSGIETWNQLFTFITHARPMQHIPHSNHFNARLPDFYSTRFATVNNAMAGLALYAIPWSPTPHASHTDTMSALAVQGKGYDGTRVCVLASLGSPTAYPDMCAVGGYTYPVQCTSSSAVLNGDGPRRVYPAPRRVQSSIVYLPLHSHCTASAEFSICIFSVVAPKPALRRWIYPPLHSQYSASAESPKLYTHCPRRRAPSVDRPTHKHSPHVVRHESSLRRYTTHPYALGGYVGCQRHMRVYAPCRGTDGFGGRVDPRTWGAACVQCMWISRWRKWVSSPIFD